MGTGQVLENAQQLTDVWILYRVQMPDIDTAELILRWFEAVPGGHGKSQDRGKEAQECFQRPRGGPLGHEEPEGVRGSQEEDQGIVNDQNRARGTQSSRT